MYSVDFYEPGNILALCPGESIQSVISILTNGSSMATILPVVVEIIKTRKFDITTEKAIETVYSEVMGKSENESEELNEAPSKDPETRAYIDAAHKKKNDALAKYRSSHSEEDKIEWKKAVKELHDIWIALADGAHTAEEIKISIEKRLAAKTEVPQELKKAEEKVEKIVEINKK